MKQIQKESYHWLRISKHVFKQTLQIDVPVHDLSILHLIILSIIDCNISLWGIVVKIVVYQVFSFYNNFVYSNNDEKTI
jgi:hypothetical protein